MKLPNRNKAIVDERKIREYLLSASHLVGRFKAKFFVGIGFGVEQWRELAVALGKLARNGEAQLVGATDYGRKYLIIGALTGPAGRRGEVAPVWIIGLDHPAGG